MDDLPPLSSLVETTRAGKGGLIGLVKDQMAFHEWQGRFQPAAAAFRYPPVFWLAGDNQAAYQLYTFAVHAGVLLLLALFVWELAANAVAVVAVTACFAAYPHTREAFVQFNSNGGVFESVFLLGALCAFIRGLRRHDWRWHAMAVLLWACALSAYEQSYAFCAVFPVIALIVGPRGERTVRLVALRTAPYFGAMVAMQLAHGLVVPAYRANVILQPSILFGRLVNVADLLWRQAAGLTLFEDRSTAWVAQQPSLTAVDWFLLGAVAVVLFAATFAARRPLASDGYSRIVILLGVGILFAFAGSAFFVFREGAGWYSRHHYTTALGLALAHGAVISLLVGARAARWRAVASGAMLCAAVVVMSAAQLRTARTIATWGDELEQIRSQMRREAPVPTPGAYMVVLGDVIERTGWLASDGGVWFPRLWYRRGDLEGRMGNGDERFFPGVDGWQWLEPAEARSIPYDRLMLFRFSGGQLKAVNQLDLETPDGQHHIIDLRSARPGGGIERRKLDPLAKKTWTWNR